ncbi:hypothetical protein CEXT_785771 [Caerostris extrusa]|uniref:Uncharacterized protein n=1 Tax=Caerostris extrusa TaxID=172846 RepID=A0AAV4X3S9_CAEEX|nr:hypothetical protein CEXT_785771 [Caerostris extrusa]
MPSPKQFPKTNIFYHPQHSPPTPMPSDLITKSLVSRKTEIRDKLLGLNRRGLKPDKIRWNLESCSSGQKLFFGGRGGGSVGEEEDEERILQ